MIGSEVGNFVVTAKLGEGGMGEVYLAEQKSIGTKVAIKALRAEISANKDHVTRFFNEAIAVSRIKHSGIAKIFDVGFLPSGRAYLVMEYLEGEPLSRRIRHAGRIPLAQLADIGRQIAGVLDATHQAGITHRDLKPDNIFLVADAELERGERVKVLDFGIAKLGSASQLTSTSVSSMGTPGYMAPEQWHNSKQVDWRADAYSLGCLTFEMATGRLPFLAESIAEACTKHLTVDPPRLRELVAALPVELEELVARLLEKEAARRPASLREIMQVFARVGVVAPLGLADTVAPGTAPTPTPVVADEAAVASSPARGSRAIVGAIAFAGVAIAGAIVFAVTRPSSPSVPVAPAVGTSGPPAPISVDAADPLATATGVGSVTVPPRAPAPSLAETVGDLFDAPSATPNALSRDEIGAALGRVNASVHACARTAPRARGNVVVHVEVGADGNVSAASILSAPDPSLGACVQKAVSRARFRAVGTPTTFKYPFQFVPSGD